MCVYVRCDRTEKKSYHENIFFLCATKLSSNLSNWTRLQLLCLINGRKINVNSEFLRFLLFSLFQFVCYELWRLLNVRSQTHWQNRWFSFIKCNVDRRAEAEACGRAGVGFNGFWLVSMFRRRSTVVAMGRPQWAHRLCSTTIGSVRGWRLLAAWIHDCIPGTRSWCRTFPRVWHGPGNGGKKRLFIISFFPNLRIMRERERKREKRCRTYQ